MSQSLEETIFSSKNAFNPRSKQVAAVNFTCFFFYWFSLAIERVDGFEYVPVHLDDVCARLQFNRRTATIAPRFHLKSTVTEGFLAWKMFRMERVWNEWDYMSYTQDLGMYHTKRLKRYIKALPEIFNGYKSLSDAESIIFYSYAGRSFICEPSGITSFKRGRHPTGTICDDILKDPQVKLDLSQLVKIANAFHDEVENMPREDLHVVGTPQDSEDLFNDLAKDRRYNTKIYSAEKDPEKKIALWQENPKFNWDSLMLMKSANLKSYKKEMLCMPVRGTEGFINYDQLNAQTKSRLKNYDPKRPPLLRNRTVAGGFDIGKKQHPSHCAVFVLSRRKYKVKRMNKSTGEIETTEEHRLFQIHSKFLDGWDYVDQLDYLKSVISAFQVDKMPYDNTRSEFEIMEESGTLPSQMDGVAFTPKIRQSMATEMDNYITQGIMFLVNDDRQKRQILTVDCDLKAPETAEGHGDSFWSIALAVKGAREANSLLIWSPGQN